MQDGHLKTIIDCFESVPPTEDTYYWTSKGYLLCNGILYRYHPDSEGEDAQQVVPTHEVEAVLKRYHDDDTAGHYGANFEPIAVSLYVAEDASIRKRIREELREVPEI